MQVEAKLVDVLRVIPICAQVRTNEEEQDLKMLMFIDPDSNKIYTLDGQEVEENVSEAVFRFMEMKSEEINKRLRSQIAGATPEQLSQMGIDLKNGPSKLIIP